MEYEHNKEYLCHHGILGQKWGSRNGPPYPLSSSDHSSSEKKAGWRKSINKSDSKNQNNDKEEQKVRLSDKQKKALKIGAAAAATALAAYGIYKLYKSGELDKVIDKGKGVCDSLLNKDSESIPFKRLKNPESISETIKKVNPYMGTEKGSNSCVACALAAFMRQEGYDVVSRGTGGEKQITGGVIEECFKDAHVLDGSAQVFGQSREKACGMLKSRFGNNAAGICTVDLKQISGGTTGHCFNWSIKNGVVSFFDGNTGRDDSEVSKYFNIIDTAGQLTLARLDRLEMNYDALLKYVK